MTEDQKRLEQLIQRHHEKCVRGQVAARRGRKRGFIHATQCGKYLCAMKTLCVHGQWLAWLETQEELFKQKTANNYMWLYKNRDDPELVTLTNLEAAWKVRAQRAKARKKKKQEEEEQKDVFVDAPPKQVRQLKYEFTERQEKEVNTILDRLATKVLEIDSLEIVLMRCLRYANETLEPEHVHEYKLRPIEEYLAEKLGEGTIQEALTSGTPIKQILQSYRHRKRALDSGQAGRDSAA